MHKLLKCRPRADKVESRVFYPLPLTAEVFFVSAARKKPYLRKDNRLGQKTLCLLADIGGSQFDNAIFFDRRCAFQRVAVY